MNKRQVKVGMVLKLKYCYEPDDAYYDYKESMYYDYIESIYLVIKNDKEKDYVEAFDQGFNTVKISRDDLKKYKVTGQYHKNEWNFMFDKIR